MYRPVAPPHRTQELVTGFSLDVRGPVDGVTVVVPRGELDIATVPELESWLDDLRIRCASVVVDLSEVEFIDSTGLRALARAGSRAAQARTSLRLEGASPALRRAFRLVGFDPARPERAPSGVVPPG